MSLLSDRALTGKESSASYMASVLGKIVVLAKRRFDIFMNLASETESAFKNCQRRGDLDRWYPQLVLAVCQNIENIADDPNTILSQLKIACLEPQKKDAKQNYQQALDNYVKEYMGRPMEKLQTFFDHIDACISQGMQPETIAYQQNFSKLELKKAISAHPGKEVKKGLEQLYKKVEKHLCEEENLLQVVWRNMSEEFIQQYKNYQDLIGKCYYGAEIQMEFGINDILAYFSDIAQQH
uniref:Exocyst complex component Sec3 C-terminal domain-containing protein n=1 Tax=Romanomermis culicivorax TaxID=13658 RepID=A0A915L6I7_ROMCU